MAEPRRNDEVGNLQPDDQEPAALTALNRSKASDKKRQSDAVDHALGSALRQLREARGLTQTELGRRLGVSLQQVQKYESGANRMAASTVCCAGEILGVGVEAFYIGATRPQKSPSRTSRASAKSFLIIPYARGASKEGAREAELIEIAMNYQAIDEPSVRAAVRRLLQRLSPAKTAGRRSSRASKRGARHAG